MKRFFVALLFCCTIAFFQCQAKVVPIKAVIFDFGGVIAATDRALFVDFLSESLDISKEKAIALLKELHAHKDRGGTDIDYWNTYIDTLGYDYKRKRFWMRQWDRTKALSVKEIPGMIDLVQNLQAQGYQTPLFSNVTENLAETVFKSGYYDYFEPLYLSYQMECEKPDEQSYRMVLDGLQLKPEVCVFIDDKLENVEAAKKIGIDGIHFKSAPQLIEELKKRHIDVKVKHEA